MTNQCRILKSEMAVFEISSSCAWPQFAAPVLSLTDYTANIRRGRAGFFLNWAAVYQNKIVPGRCHVGHTVLFRSNYGNNKK